MQSLCRNTFRLAVSTGVAALLASSTLAARSDGADCVVVAVDLDAAQPGFQTTLVVPPGTTRVEGVTLWIRDPNEAAVIYSIGHVGGLNRGLAFGHAPDPSNRGTVTAVIGDTVEPVVAGHTAFLNNGFSPLFAGPELQYFESGSPGVIPAAPAAPIVNVAIDLDGAAPGDAFRFYLGDMTAVWLEQMNLFDGGAFSTTGLGTLDAGGDAVPDGTETAIGPDADVPAPSPPAPFLVDYVDGGGATIVVGGAAVPALPTWGLAALTGMLLVAGAVVARRRLASA